MPAAPMGRLLAGWAVVAGVQLDRFWADRLPPSRKGTRWDQVLQVLVAYRLIAPGSEWKLHRDWYGKSAMADLLGADFGLAERHKLYACHDMLWQHKAALFDHLVARWRDLFNAVSSAALRSDQTYFEVNSADVPEGDKRRHGYSRDKRPDCPQVVIALVVTPEGLPLAYEVLPGNTADCNTLRDVPRQDRAAIRQARRVWVMDRGIPTKAVLAEMRASDPPVHMWSARPKGARAAWRSSFSPCLGTGPCRRRSQAAAAGRRTLRVRSECRPRQQGTRDAQAAAKWLWERLRGAVAMEISREEMLMKLGAARASAPTAWRLVDIEMDAESSMFSYGSIARSCG